MRNLICAAAALTLAAGCVEGGLGAGSGGDTDDIATNRGDVPSWDEFLANTYREPNEGPWIVNGDVPIWTEKELRAFYQRLTRHDGALIVNTIGGRDDIWNEQQRVNLTYCVSTSFGSRYDAMLRDMKAGAALWEESANLKFVHLPSEDSNCNASNSNVVFDIRPVSGQSYLARAFFPAQPRSQRNVLVDTSSFNTRWSLTNIMAHELGHTLGFRHEHTRREAGTCFEDNNWRALTPYDSDSIMHYPQCNGTDPDLNFSAGDRVGAEAIYGPPGDGCAFADPNFETPIVDEVTATVPFTIPDGCDDVEADGGTLAWRVRGGTQQGSVTLRVSGNTLVGDMPTFEPNTVIEYTITARGNNGRVTTFPANEADPEYQLYFGDTDSLFFDDFESGSGNWSLNGFQVGVTRASEGGDPADAYSGRAVLSDSLGADYSADANNVTASVTVGGFDARRYESVRLQFRRYLNIEDSAFDEAVITVDGTEVFTNATRGLPGDNNAENDLHHLDREWRFVDIDITNLAQDGSVTIAVSLQSDAGLQFGGWNLDDVAVVGFLGGAFCGDGNTDPDEECDDGNNDNGDGCSATCTTEGGGDGDGDGDTTGGDGDGDGDTTGGDGDGDGDTTTGGDGDGDTTTTSGGDGDDDGTGDGGGGGGGGTTTGGCSVSDAAPGTALPLGLFLALAFIRRRRR